MKQFVHYFFGAICFVTCCSVFSATSDVWISNNTPLTLELNKCLYQIYKDDQAQLSEPLFFGGKIYIAPWQRVQLMSIDTKVEQGYYQFKIEVQPYVNNQKIGDPIELYQELHKKPLDSDIKLIGDYIQGLNETGWEYEGRAISVHSSFFKPRSFDFPDIEYAFSISPFTGARFDERSNRIHLFQYNIYLMHKIVDPFDLLEKKKRAKLIPFLIKGLFREIKPGIVTFNEAFSTRKKLIQSMRMEGYPYHTEVFGRPDIDDVDGNAHLFKVGGNGGVILFSHWPIEAFEGITYRNCYDRECAVAKGALYARINKNGMIYHIFATHVQSDIPNSNIEKCMAARAAQFKELKKFIEQKIDDETIRSKKSKKDGIEKRITTEPIIVVGDFNVPKERTSEHENAMNILDVTDIAPDGYQYSDVQGTMLLDYITLYKNALQPYSAYTRVLRETRFQYPWTNGGEYLGMELSEMRFHPSDHYPLYGYFEF